MSTQLYAMDTRHYSWIKFTTWDHVILGLGTKKLILNGNVSSKKFIKQFTYRFHCIYMFWKFYTLSGLEFNT